MDIESMLNERIPRYTRSGIKYYSLKIEYDILQLCYHLYKDTKYEVKKKNNESLRAIGFTDLYRYISIEDNIQWEVFYKIVVNAKIENQIYFILRFLTMVFNNINDKQLLHVINRLEIKADKITCQEVNLKYKMFRG